MGGVVAALVLAGAIPAALVYFGAYNVAATNEHTRPVYWLIETMGQRSVKWRASKIEVPDLGKPEQVARGFALFAENCVLCHGAPGVPPDNFAKGLAPGAPPLAQTGRDWKPEELYWAIRYGIKMTAMPAWEFRLDDADLWALVAFLQVLPNLSPDAYKTMLANRKDPPKPAAEVAAFTEQVNDPPDRKRGESAFHQYSCHMCHTAPGTSGPEARAGPPLKDLAKRVYIGGLTNTPENLVRWIRHPQEVKPGTAMPDLGVTERDGRDIAAWLGK